ncbi:MAG: TolC family protein [Bdellovibrionales bacterium]|nr:TolC family protein [Bdellovibrionales bacterium]
MIPLLLIFLTASPAHAETLTRDGAVREALGQSPAYAKSQAAAEEQDWKRAETFSYFLPTLQVTASRYFVKQLEYNDLDFGGSPAHIPLIYPATRASLNFNWNLFDGFGNFYRYSGARRLSDAARDEADWARFQTEEDTLLHFNEAVAARELQSVAEQNVATLKDHLDQVTRTRKGGLATQYDVLRVEVQLNEANSELLRAKDDVVLARQKLSQALGVDPTTDTRELSGELEIPLTTGVDQLKLGDGQDRKDLQAAGLRAEAADRQSAAASTYWIPRIGLGAQYTLYNNLTDGMTDWDQYRAAWNAGIFLTWNIFDLGLVAKSKAAGYQSVEAQKSYQAARLAMPTDFEFWKRRYLYSAALYEAKLSDVKKGEESVRLAKAAMKAGVRTNSEVLDAELDLFRARAGLVNALKGSTEARIKLELALGRKLPNLSKPAKNPS